MEKERQSLDERLAFVNEQNIDMTKRNDVVKSKLATSQPFFAGGRTVLAFQINGPGSTITTIARSGCSLLPATRTSAPKRLGNPQMPL